MKLAWYLPITWTEYINAPLGVRTAWFRELNDIKREMSGHAGAGAFSGQSRTDRKLGLE